MTPTTFTIIIPVHNEAENLAGPFSSFIKWMNTRGEVVFGGLQNVEILFAEDGSTDHTLSLLHARAREFHCDVRIIHSAKRLGKGGGFKNGFLQARNDVVILYDSDLSVSPDQLSTLKHKMETGCDIVIGARNAAGSRIVSFPTFIRFFYGKVLYLLAKFLFFIPFKETQCGFKAFKRRRVEPVIRELALSGWLFDLELLLRAHYHRFKIEEIPVVYKYFKTSKIHNIKDPIQVVLDLLILRAKILPYYLILPTWFKRLFKKD